MSKKLLIIGNEGMVGSAIFATLKNIKNVNLEILTLNKSQLDLRNQMNVQKFFQLNKVDEVILAAAKVGGIEANNTYPVKFLYDNLMIQNNVINSCHQSGVNKLLFLGSSCIYPRNSKQPISESEMLSGYLEKTNEPYAVAKIAGIKLCESFNREFGRDYRTVIPTNLYGKKDNFHPDNSHVIPGLINRFHDAVTNNINIVKIWGSGNQLREFMHVDDMASACIFTLNLSKQKYDEVTDPMNSIVNIGTSKEIEIKALAKMIAKITNFKGEIIFDENKPDGTPRKLLDTSKLSSLGWNYTIELEEGIKETYFWYKENYKKTRHS